MKVLFDQNTPRNLLHHLLRHTVTRAAEMGWQELKNGDLLDAADSGGFDLLLRTDKNLAHQQNLSRRRIAVVCLSTSNWPIMKPPKRGASKWMGRRFISSSTGGPASSTMMWRIKQ